MITKEELDVLITEIEQDRVEKTKSVANTDKFGEALCAFANDFPNHQKQGYLIVGVNGDGSRSRATAPKIIKYQLASKR